MRTLEFTPAELEALPAGLRRIVEGDAPPETPNPAVTAMVREQLERSPPPPLAALYGRAVRIDPRVRKLTLRQFNARYPLQIRRAMKPAEARRRKRTQVPSPSPVAADGPQPPAATPSTNGRARETAPRPPGDAEARRRIRAILFEWANLVAGARSKAEVVEAMTRVDEHARRVVRALSDDGRF